MFKHNSSRRCHLGTMALAILTASVLSGCASMSPEARVAAEKVRTRQFHIEEIGAERAAAILGQLHLGTAFVLPGHEIIVVRGTPDELDRAAVVVDVVDTGIAYTVERLGPAHMDGMPDPSEFAQVLGDAAIGTLAEPPRPGARTRGIIDVLDGDLVAVVPIACCADLLTFVERRAKEAAHPVAFESSPTRDAAQTSTTATTETADEAGLLAQSDGQEADAPGREPGPRAKPPQGSAELPQRRGRPIGAQTGPTSLLPGYVQADHMPDSEAEILPSGRDVEAVEPSAEPIGNVSDSLNAQQERTAPAIENTDEVLQLDLPQQLDMIQLLDLVGEYMGLDYMYDPAKIKGQIVTLKLHGKLRGRMRVKDLYSLLESVLKFKGFAMTCHEGNLVTIVPAAEALQANPDLLERGHERIDAGDMVVTSIFELQGIDTASASTLLQNMKLSLAVTPVDGTQALIVTCYAHQVERIERLLELVDRPGRPKEFRFRQLEFTMAKSLTAKVRELGSRMENVTIGSGAPDTGPSRTDRPRPMAASLSQTLRGSNSSRSTDDEVYLDADERTNRILMIGYAEQLLVVEELIGALDVAQQDLRVRKIYDVRYVEADEVKRKLQELGILGSEGAGRGAPGPAAKITAAEIIEGTVTEAAQVVVLEATNSLVISATEEQHERIEAMMDYLDAEVRREAIPYEIYFLENQDPEDLAAVLEKIIHETVQDKEGKLQKILRNSEDEIMIVPDTQTFSLIVYASRKNQEWISKLITTLDRRRPQVLIDVTLVEIRKSDEFNYDLNLITSLPDLLETGGQIGSFYAGEQTVVEKLLESDTRSQYADLQFNAGQATGFYADVHVNALLKAMQMKNYGRVLAKPKVLVNDNEVGTIKTTDTTYVTKKSSIPVTSGSAGSQNTLIETAIEYEPYDAGITLEITPHISEGRLLRLDINLTRSDFTLITGEKPPDQTSSDINTVVTVPDGSTIILGGMLRLNQSKGGSKVPILGDLPIIGLPFRSIANSDIQSKLYVFVKAEVIRPVDAEAAAGQDLERISEQNRAAFESYERQFQRYQNWPGIKPNPIEPQSALDAQ